VGPYQTASAIPNDIPLTNLARIKVHFGLLDVRTSTSVSTKRTKSHLSSSSPNVPGMGARNVDLAVLVPERLGVIASEVEVDGVRPRLGVVRVLGLEDDL
jgi:hypothetical protein